MRFTIVLAQYKFNIKSDSKKKFLNHTVKYRIWVKVMTKSVNFSHYLLINWKPGNIRRTWYLPCDWCIPNYFPSRFDYNLCFIHVSVCKTCFQCPVHTKNWPNWRDDTANDVVYVALVSLLLTLNRFHTLFCCLYCLIRTSKNAGWVVFATRNNLGNSKQIE